MGASGSGKSSVMLAGLLPRLKGGGIPGSDAWLYLDSITPGPHPLEALALTLSQQPALGNAAFLHHELRGDSLRALYLLTCQLIHFPSHNVVLFIDQFEELFSSQVREEDRQHFLDLLITAVTEPEGPLLVVVTMRSDFLNRAMLYPDLYGLLDAHHVTVLPMERDELRQVIEAPARLPDVQITFEGDLVGDLLFELRGQVGALPLLEFTLDQLFAVRSDQILTMSAYREIGGVKGALGKRAKATYDTLPTKKHQELARSLFLRLIDPGQSEHDTTRRRARLSEFELPDLVQTRLLRETMDAFLNARLLTSNEQAGVATIEVSHEALIREWLRLIEWLREAREDIQLQLKVSEDAVTWQQRGRPNDRLYRGSQLKEAWAWAKRNSTSQQEGSFLQAATRRERRLLMNAIALALALVMTLGGTLWFSLWLRQPPDPTQVTTLANDGTGSLRWALDTAPSGKIITFAPNLAGQTITLTDTLMIPNKHFQIQGPSRKITLSNPKQGINVSTGANIAITNMLFTGSRDNSGSLLTNKGHLTLTNSTISGNSSSGSGGGIFNDGTLTLINSTVSDNSAPLLLGLGGGIFNDGTLTLINSTVSGNSSPNGVGGGIYNVRNAALSNISVSSGNSISFDEGIDNTGILTLINSTISDNSASLGGGINNIAGTITLAFCTLYNNSAPNGGTINTDDDTSTDSPHPGISIILNSVFVGNKASQGSDIAGKLTTQGYNLIQAKGSVILDPNHKHHTDYINIPDSQIKTDPHLQLNGSVTTKTHALLPGSLAIDAIPRTVCHTTINGVPIETDQRGIKRPQGSACDIGAYEYKP